MASIINADTSGGLKLTSDTSGEIEFQSAGTKIASLTAGALEIPTGTTAQRPGSPTTGMTRYNTDTGQMEIYNATYNTWNVAGIPGSSYDIEYLVIAGGGGSPNVAAAGAGGYRTSSLSAQPGSTHTIIVGAGGAIQTVGDDSVFSTITSLGGGRGGIPNTVNYIGGTGGSGGGTSYSSGGTAVTSGGGAGTVGQGNNGGGHAAWAGGAAGGGGGGAGAAGTTSTAGGIGGNGGNGLASSITGSSVTRAGGGAGSGESGNGTAGTGGGGAVNSNGTANTGGGAGAGSRTGGSGVVILSLLTANYSGTTTGSPTVTTSGANTILQYTSSGSYTA